MDIVVVASALSIMYSQNTVLRQYEHFGKMARGQEARSTIMVIIYVLWSFPIVYCYCSPLQVNFINAWSCIRGQDCPQFRSNAPPPLAGDGRPLFWRWKATISTSQPAGPKDLGRKTQEQISRNLAAFWIQALVRTGRHRTSDVQSRTVRTKKTAEQEA
jgi:hypothetical protein